MRLSKLINMNWEKCDIQEKRTSIAIIFFCFFFFSIEFLINLILIFCFFSSNGSGWREISWSVVWSKHYCTGAKVLKEFLVLINFIQFMNYFRVIIQWFHSLVSFFSLFYRKLVLFDDSNDLAVHVAMDNTVVIEDLSKLHKPFQRLTSRISNIQGDLNFFH